MEVIYVSKMPAQRRKKPDSLISDSNSPKNLKRLAEKPKVPFTMLKKATKYVPILPKPIKVSYVSNMPAQRMKKPDSLISDSNSPKNLKRLAEKPKVPFTMMKKASTKYVPILPKPIMVNVRSIPRLEDLPGFGQKPKTEWNMGSSNQQYCLRWNNHRSNLLLVFEHLFHTEAFTDVTLACDGHSVKCHKMVLAACSSYFQSLFLENDCRHPIVILKDILYSEVKAILEYMYKGEVNVAQDQLSGLLKAAETLKVKGLVEDHQQRPPGSRPVLPPSPYHPQPTPPSSVRPNQPPPHPPSAPVEYENITTPPSYPKISNSMPSKTFVPNDSIFDASYNPSSTLPERNSLPFPMWSTNKISTVSSSPKHGYPNNSSYENSQCEPIYLKKKKSSLHMNNSNKDTPILRTVLGHNSLQSNSEPQHTSLNYSLNNSPSNGPTDRDMNDKGLAESPEHFMDDSARSMDSDKMHDDNHSFTIDPDDKHGPGPGMASFLHTPNPKPEWKRYKQYTRNDIMAAIEAVRGGMSALQAARKYNVPSRTLYDKVKKLGITTNRPYRKGSFPMSPYQGHQRVDEASGYSPEELPLDISTARNGNGLMMHGQEGDRDSDKMDSDPGSNIKQEHEQSPPMDDMMDDPHYLGRHSGGSSEEHGENGGGSSEVVGSSPSPPRGRDSMEIMEDTADTMTGQRLMKVVGESGIISSAQRLIKEEI